MKLLKSSIWSFLGVLIRGISALSINKLFALGEQCQFAISGFEECKKELSLAASSVHFEDMDQLIVQLRNELQGQIAHGNRHLNILVKGMKVKERFFDKKLDYSFFDTILSKISKNSKYSSSEEKMIKLF